MAESTDNAGESEEPNRIPYHYQKAPDYRTIHCDGAFGGITSRGYLSVTVYNERNTLPQRTSRQIMESLGSGAYRLGDQETEYDLGGIMRQLEGTFVLDLLTAQEVYTWLGGKVAEMEESYGVPEEQRVGRPQK